MNTLQTNFEPLPAPGGSDERVEQLRKLSPSALATIIRDYCSDDIGIGWPLMAVGLDPHFRNTEPEELFDLLAPIIREHIAAKKSQNERTLATEPAGPGSDI